MDASGSTLPAAPAPARFRRSADRRALHERAARPRTVTFFGNFGAKNLGNECTLRAIVENARRFVPAASVSCVCANVAETEAVHGIPAVRISYRYGRPPAGVRSHPLVRLVRRLVVRAPREAVEWLEAYRALGGTSMLVMTGTGMLSDFGIGPLDLHYEILKWTVLAKLRRRKVLFVSVGAGPIAHPLSRWIVKRALSLADYRSYRDAFSQRYLQSIGFDASRDPVYPDLAFSLTLPEDEERRSQAARVVGLGLMEYYGQHVDASAAELTYHRYVDEVARFAAWLLEQGYVIRLLVGDLSYDARVKRDLLGAMERRAAGFPRGRVLDEPTATLEELYRQIGNCDVVVATRFHNVVLSLVRGRPVIAVSYHEKVRALMTELGLGEYCDDVAGLDAGRLIERFRALETNADALTSSIRRIADRCRASLDEQYGVVFGAGSPA